MDIDVKFTECNYNLNQIRRFNPDPYYVNHFLQEFLQDVMDVYDGIFEEACRDFGIFVLGKPTKTKFEKKAKEKNDKSAIEFFTWFEENYKNEHDSPYPKFMDKVISCFKKDRELPNITIKILAKDRYKDDVVQEIKIGIGNEKISLEELQIEVARQTPIFLQIINQKRTENSEPKVSEKQIVASTFLELGNFENIEIPYACEIYFPVLKRIVAESKEKIKKLSRS
jgi:hypothetical protein